MLPKASTVIIIATIKTRFSVIHLPNPSQPRKMHIHMHSCLHLKPHHHQAKPTNIVHGIHHRLLVLSNSTTHKDFNHHHKASKELPKLLEELHDVLYGDSEGAEPDPKSCAEIALEFFKDEHSDNNLFRLLLKRFPEMERESKKLVSQIVINLFGQHLPSSSNLIVGDYLERNLDLVDFLVSNMFDLVDNCNDVALLYGIMLKECLHRSQSATKHVLESQRHMKKFLEYVTLPNYSFATHVADTLVVLLRRHKSIVADFLARNYEWFFEEFNSKVILSSNQLTKSQALALLREVLLEGKNRGVMARYVNDVENLKVLMNALKESKRVQLNAFRVFELFVENPEMAKGIKDILRLNKKKLVELVEELKASKEDKGFDEEKGQVIRRISMLEEVNCKPISMAHGYVDQRLINVA